MLIPNAMLQFVDLARENKCDFLVVASSDVGWGRGYIKKMIGLNLPVVGGWANGRCWPFSCHVCQEADWGNGLFKPVEKPEKHHGVEQVCSNGGELVVYRMDVFDKIPRPWFFGPDMVLTDRLMTEDYYFALQAHKHGVPMYVDWDCPLVHCADGMITQDGVVRVNN